MVCHTVKSRDSEGNNNFSQWIFSFCRGSGFHARTLPKINSHANSLKKILQKKLCMKSIKTDLSHAGSGNIYTKDVGLQL